MTIEDAVCILLAFGDEPTEDQKAAVQEAEKLINMAAQSGLESFRIEKK